MSVPPRNSILWSTLLLAAIAGYLAPHVRTLPPGLSETLKDAAMFVGVISAKLAASPLREDNANRSWLRRLLDAVAAEVP